MATPPAAASHGDELDVLMCIYHHVFLPPKLPGGVDDEVLSITELVKWLRISFQNFKSRMPDEDGALIESALGALKAFGSCHDDKEQITGLKFGRQLDKLINPNTPNQGKSSTPLKTIEVCQANGYILRWHHPPSSRATKCGCSHQKSIKWHPL